MPEGPNHRMRKQNVVPGVLRPIVCVWVSQVMPAPRRPNPSDLGELLRAVDAAGMRAAAARGLSQAATFSFESGGLPSGWTTGSSGYSWTRRSGGTPSSSTGPSSAYDGSYYMYIETSGGSSGKLFDLSYTCPQGGAPQISWRYHMYGSSIGTLRVRDGTGAAVWVKSGAQGNTWQSASVVVPGVSFTFEGER
eukprot:3984413-Prymnesium_polylepis.1